jgi:hypothetical protein
MNFKTLVAKVNLHAGLQGVIASTDASGYQEYLSEAVRSSWSDLQLQREDWKFMWETMEFTTTAGTNEYTNDFLTSALDHGVSKWKKTTLLRNNDIQIFKNYDEYWNHKEEWESSLEPRFYTIREYREDGLIIISPNSTDVIRADYYRTPQILEGNTSVPLLPEEFHYLIVWKALEDVAAYLGNQSIYERNSYKADILENKLMRSQVPAKKIRRKPFYVEPINQY